MGHCFGTRWFIICADKMKVHPAMTKVRVDVMPVDLTGLKRPITGQSPRWLQPAPGQLPAYVEYGGRATAPGPLDHQKSARDCSERVSVGLIRSGGQVDYAVATGAREAFSYPAGLT